MTKDGPKMGCENGKLFLGEPLTITETPLGLKGGKVQGVEIRITRNSQTTYYNHQVFDSYLTFHQQPLNLLMAK